MTTSGVIWLQVLVLVVAVFSSSCSDFLKGKPFKSDSIELKSAGLDCVNDVSLNFDKMINDQATTTDVDSTFSCIDSTLTEFQSRVEGRADASSFNADDLYLIFDKFVKTDAVSRQAAQDLLLLKAAIFGGDKTKITKAEISQLKDYLQIVKAEVKKLLPFVTIFHFDTANQTITKTHIEDGIAQLNSSMKTLFTASKILNSDYSFDNFKDLILDLKVLKGDQQKMIRLATQINSVMNGNVVVTTQGDAFLYIDSLTELMRLYSLYNQSYFKFEISTPDSLNNTISFIESGLGVIENCLQYKKTYMISASSLDGLFSEIANSNLLPFPISASAAVSFYKTVVVRVLETGLEAIPTISGINRSHIYQIKKELAIFKIYSRFLERIAGPTAMSQAGVQRLPIATVQNQLRTMTAVTEQDILAPFDTTLQSQIIQQVEELKSEFLGLNPMIYRYGKMVVADNQAAWDQNWQDLAHGMVVKMLARELLIGWGIRQPNKNILDAYMSEPGMVRWYSEFKSIGIALGALDPRADNLGKGELAAGNLFTRAGNGDKKMTFQETVESLGQLVSGSGEIATEITDGLNQAHCNLPETDVFGKNWNNEACFYQVIISNYHVYFSNFPYLVSYLDRLTVPQFNQFILGMLNVSRNDMSNQGRRVETSDIRAMGSMLYFMETLYLVHDLNRNTALSESEIKHGYPIFQGFATDFANSTSQSQLKQFTSIVGDLAGYGCFSKEDLIRESFVFMVYNGRTPGIGDLETLPCFLGKPLIKFSGEVDRMRILGAFKVIKSSLE